MSDRFDPNNFLADRILLWFAIAVVGLGLVFLVGVRFYHRRHLRVPRAIREAAPPLWATAAAPPAPVGSATTGPVHSEQLAGTVDYRPSPGVAFPVQVGRYRILGLLGKGGMGTVYRAHDPQLDREVALKFPRFDGPSEEVARRIERFLREARAAARMLHPNVCPIFDVGEHEGQPYVVMALIEGESLAQRLSARGRYDDVHEAIGVVQQALVGLAVIHAHGIIHRDLKPANILLDESGRAVLTDFGLARPVTEAGHLTAEGVILGTPAYMAPEQAAVQSERIGPATDLYSLGVVLYQMLTGRPPFTGTVPAVLAQILRDEPPPPRMFRPDLDPGLQAVLLRALCKDPAKRYPDAQSFAKALDAWAARAAPIEQLADLRATAFVSPAPDPTRPLTLTRQRRLTLGRVAGWLIGGVVLTVGMAMLALLALLLIRGIFIPVISLVIFTPPVVLLGLYIWSITEAGYVPEGLLLAAREGRVSLVRRALANGVPADVCDEMGETALMHAATLRHAEVVKLLLRHGASPGLRNSFGQTALDMAQAAGYQEIAAVLANAGMSAGPPVGPLPRLDAARGLLATAAVGGLLTLVLVWLFTEPLPAIPREEFRLLVERGRIAHVTFITIPDRIKWAEGELKDPRDPEARRLGLTGRKFTTDLSAEAIHIDLLKQHNVPFSTKMEPFGAEPPLRPPAAWGQIPVLGLPLLVALLLGLPLGAPHWFPVLGRPRRPATGTAAA